MNLSAQIAKHLRDVYSGGNYTGVNLRDALADVDWKMATTKIGSFNTIVALVYHINYYVIAVSKVLQGEPLDASDKFAFDHPQIESEEVWKKFMEQFWTDAENFAVLIEQLPENKFLEPFLDGKYGTYYRNIAGVIEHTHYHLGQIVLIKKLLS
jgi:excinuclease UvrABC nuclease subunit